MLGARNTMSEWGSQILIFGVYSSFLTCMFLSEPLTGSILILEIQRLEDQNPQAASPLLSPVHST